MHLLACCHWARTAGHACVALEHLRVRCMCMHMPACCPWAPIVENAHVAQKIPCVRTWVNATACCVCRSRGALPAGVNLAACPCNLLIRSGMEPTRYLCLARCDRQHLAPTAPCRPLAGRAAHLDDVVQLPAHHLPLQHSPLRVCQRILQLAHLALQLSDLQKKHKPHTHCFAA